MIQLKCGEWRFPQTSCCPVNGCGIQFGSRLDAIMHYEQRHAMNAVLCHLCNRPIRTDVQSDALTRHFRKLHPNQEIPYRLGKNRIQSADAMFHAEEVRSNCMQKYCVVVYSLKVH